MNQWIKLNKHEHEFISRGELLKFKATYPFEDEVVMMVCEGPESSSQRCLLTITGHKAGINCYQVLPPEASSDNCFLSTSWLIKNWKKWVWPDGDVNDVWVRAGLDFSEL